MKSRLFSILLTAVFAGCAATDALGRQDTQGDSTAKRPAPSAAEFDAFREAVNGGELDAVRAMLQKNPALATAKDSHGETALHSAILGGTKEMVELLLTNKADVNAANDRGHTPLHNAAMSPLTSREMAVLLIERKADVNARDRKEETPLHAAANNGSINVAEVLIGRVADVDAKDKYGNTPLHWAATAYQGRSRDEGSGEDLEAWKEVIKLLLDHKADANAKNNRGVTPLKTVEGHGEIEELMRKYVARE